MSREWRAELIGTLPDGTRSYRVVRPRRIANYKRQFMSLYDEGLNDRKIGEALGFHRDTIGHFRRKLGLPPNKIVKKSRIDKAKFLELYGQGLSDRKIGETLGLAGATMSSYRRGLGLPAHFTFSRPGLSDREKLRIRELHAEGLPITDIAEEISRSSSPVIKFCRGEGLDTSGSRAKGYARRQHGKRVIAYLEERGPTPQSALSRELGISRYQFPRLSRELFEQIERFRFYGDIGEMGVVFAIRGDPRVVGFVAERTPFKVETAADARTLALRLKKQIGYDRAREVVERLGYRYQTPSHKSKRGRRPIPTRSTPDPKKFTDEQFLKLYKEELNDAEIAAVLGASREAIGYRRRKFALPAYGRGRFRVLNFLTQIEEDTT